MINLLNPVEGDKEKLVDEDGGLGVKYRLHQTCCGNKKRLLIFLLVLLSIIGIAVVVAVAVILTRPKICETALCHNISQGPKICETALCYNISRAVSSQLDKSVDPCDDFYSYACGGFFKRHQLGANQSSIDELSILHDDNMKVLRRALQNVTGYSQSSSVMKTVKIYNSCINTSAIDNRGVHPMAELIDNYGGWTVTGRGQNSWTVAEKMGKVLRDLNVQTLLSVAVRTDLMDSSKHILNFGGSTLGMAPSYYTKETSQSLKIQQAYQTYMRTIAGLLGGGFVARLKMIEIYDFEKKLANAMEGNIYSEDLVETLEQYHRSGRSLDSLDGTISDFCDKSLFDENFILSFLETAFRNQAITFNSWEKVFYVQDGTGDAPIYKGIHDAFRDSKEEVIKDYIMWRVVDSYVMSMPHQFVEAKMKYVETVAGVRQFERWSLCLSEMMTPMDMTLGRLFVDADFDETTKNTVRDMTKRIREAFTNNVKSEDWMDSTTKAKANEKANAIKEDVGYPSYIKEDKKLDERYLMLTVVDDYFENSVAMKKMLIQRQFRTLRQPVNKDAWSMGPTTTNAYYSPQQNRIVILAGIIQSPLYRKIYPKYFNYGSLAMVIGHEITHGFDSRGRLFDKNGNVKDWWSLSSTVNFNEKASCLVDQYNKYEVFGEYINGLQTLNENIADNGGIKLAYDAYQSWVDDNEKEGQLPDLGLSVDQLFFIGFATSWCSVYKKEAALFQLKTDVHSYNKYRVIGSLSNFPRFSKAFRCSKGSEMNPKDECSVW